MVSEMSDFQWLISGSYHYGKLHLVHKNGPCSPQSKERKTTPSLEEILLQDELRVRSIQSRINKSGPLGLGDSKVTIPTKSGLSLGTRDFIVSIGLGTPKQDVLVVMDTGSDLTWVRCQPCIDCSAPIFDNSISSSYSSFACGSIECSQVRSSTQCTSASGCVYEIHYGDEDFSIGLFGQETLTLTPSDVFSGFRFGCGQNNNLSDNTSGILGLSPRQVSLVSQTANTFGRIFSYCLPSSESYTGFLAFGDQAGSTTSSTTVSYTELIIDSSNPDYYYVPLIGISVGGQRLPIDPSVFTTQGTIIDSGTVISRLPPTAYGALKSAFQQAVLMSNFPPAKPISHFDTCYDLSGYETVSVPPIVLHFRGGTDIKVDPLSGALIHLGNAHYCLAFLPNSSDEELVIVGNSQQRTFEVIYDLPAQRLGFAYGACS
ncbi:PREDICTED: aspartyl protease family protein At5g10770-like [Nelumbo nucifera]|uniref:Aspartyl protease family protein At5g10770-like n=1 Tax=Nelumbo nucifera TaxID=4432 RepID=A0A1U8Q8M9_NELNU|nr:PREDICTED: aspartyl protease family protein At5g10770-like [Nelumbo nucifera]